MAVDKCFLCKKDLSTGKSKKYHGKPWHLTCLRKLRRKAKKKFSGNLDAAFKYFKDKGDF